MSKIAATALGIIFYPLILICCLPGNAVWAGNNPSKSTSAAAAPPLMQRYFPPISPFDTVGKDRPCDTTLFRDDEIIEIFVAPEESASYIDPRQIADSISTLGFDRAKEISDTQTTTLAQYQHTACTLNWFGKRGKKHIYQQAARRACVTTCAGMLLLDHDKVIPCGYGGNTNLGNMDSLIRRLNDYGLSAMVQRIDMKSSQKKTVPQLQDLLSQYGSIVLEMCCELGGHTIILDEIDRKDNSATIRDPYHGWMIKITLDSLFQDRWIDKIVYINQTAESHSD